MAECEGFYRDAPLVMAHRGASGVAPENTLAAFEAALDAGADAIELDVTRCATGEIVVIHDDRLDRTTNGSGRVAKTPLSALHQLDAGSWFAPEYAGQRIPTLEEVLDRFGHRLRINIEIKGRSLRGNGIEKEIAEMVRARGLQEQVLVSSFNVMALVRIRRAALEIERALIGLTPWSHWLAGRLAVLLARPQALHPHHSMVDDRAVSWARDRGYRINVWTVNDAQTMTDMINLGVDAVTTNYPERLRALLPR